MTTTRIRMMTSPLRASYLDSSLFVAFLRQETIPAGRGATRFAVARRILADAAAGRIRAVTSVMTLAEVRYISGDLLPAAEELQLINRVLRHPSITMADIDIDIALQGQSLGREYNLKPPDAIHLATAVRYNCAELLVWDDVFIRRVNRRPIPGLWVGEPY